MSITLHWYHAILIVGFIFPIISFWIPYLREGDGRYGLGALLTGGATLIVWLFTLCLYFSLGYFGVFK